jgi:heme-degrading monooxygenase HmoA
MYARMSMFAGLPPERIEETLQGFEQGQLPAIEQQSGFEGVLVMVDRAMGKAVAVTYWATLDDLHASDKLADQAREMALQQAKPVREPIIDSFEVVLQK